MSTNAIISGSKRNKIFSLGRNVTRKRSAAISTVWAKSSLEIDVMATIRRPPNQSIKVITSRGRFAESGYHLVTRIQYNTYCFVWNLPNRAFRRHASTKAVVNFGFVFRPGVVIGQVDELIFAALALHYLTSCQLSPKGGSWAAKGSKAE